MGRGQSGTYLFSWTRRLAFSVSTGWHWVDRSSRATAVASAIDSKDSCRLGADVAARNTLVSYIIAAQVATVGNCNYLA